MEENVWMDFDRNTQMVLVADFTWSDLPEVNYTLTPPVCPHNRRLSPEEFSRKWAERDANMPMGSEQF